MCVDYLRHSGTVASVWHALCGSAFLYRLHASESRICIYYTCNTNIYAACLLLFTVLATNAKYVL